MAGGADRGGAAPAYRLTMNLAENRYPRGVRVDNVANRYELVLVVDHTLTAIGGTAAGAEARLISNLTSGQAYFNIHTAANSAAAPILLTGAQATKAMHATA